MGSFRWAQSGGYGVVPNAAMPNVFMAQAFDLADPYENTDFLWSGAEQYANCRTTGLFDPKYGW